MALKLQGNITSYFEQVVKYRPKILIEDYNFFLHTPTILKVITRKIFSTRDFGTMAQLRFSHQNKMQENGKIRQNDLGLQKI